MKTVALLLAIAASASALEWSDLRVRWDLNSLDPQHTKIFFEIPRTLRDAVSAGWVMARVKQSCKVSTWCLPKDPRFCVLFDSYGHVAGVQAGILVDDVRDVQGFYDMSRVNEFRIETIFGRKVWLSTAYTQNPVVLARGGRSHRWDNLTGTEGVWLQTKRGYLQIPRSLTAGLDSVWVKEACIQTIGQHYFYNTRNTTACQHFEPWFLLYQGQTLSGIGFQSYGKRTSQDRVWYENISTAQVRIGIPNGPQCLYDWSDAYNGIISMHMFFTPDPWTITCPVA